LSITSILFYTGQSQFWVLVSLCPDNTKEGQKKNARRRLLTSFSFIAFVPLMASLWKVSLKEKHLIFQMLSKLFFA
jgi:hypothetical protein